MDSVKINTNTTNGVKLTIKPVTPDIEVNFTLEQTKDYSGRPFVKLKANGVQIVQFFEEDGKVVFHRVNGYTSKDFKTEKDRFSIHDVIRESPEFRIPF